MNEGIQIPFDDLPGKIVIKRLEPDHIVSMDNITRMEGFGKLTERQQLEILNNSENMNG
ncbi:hypothetical protein [Paenibacillus fonticola]|uniref:hypothetical protein n=1 Tax=Paenibacillus fonticola TaxID=379896 RepID=UPI00036FD5D9|nr:hypothetical protein [Paenibacillus fonticola]